VRFGDQTFEEMMIGFFEVTPVQENLQDPNYKAKPLTRLEEFNVILAATKGEPDDNVKVGAFMAMADPNIFRQFGFILRTMVPQVDRVCVTTVKDGKLVEVMGPSSRGPSKDDDDDENDAEVEKLIAEAKKKAGQKPVESIYSPLPEVDAKGEALAEYLAAGKPVVNADLTKAKGQAVAAMVKRGAKSSLHVPVEIQGQKVLINFWSTDANAFSPQAEALLTGVAKIMAAPKDNAQAAAK
jgi:GAF domain-containing protein